MKNINKNTSSFDTMINKANTEVVPTLYIGFKGDRPDGGRLTISKGGSVKIIIIKGNNCAYKDFDDKEITGIKKSADEDKFLDKCDVNYTLLGEGPVDPICDSSVECCNDDIYPGNDLCKEEGIVQLDESCLTIMDEYDDAGNMSFFIADYYCSHTKIILPEEVFETKISKISGLAFKDKSLEYLEIPASYKTITGGVNTFSGSKLSTVIIHNPLIDLSNTSFLNANTGGNTNFNIKNPLCNQVKNDNKFTGIGIEPANTYCFD